MSLVQNGVIEPKRLLETHLGAVLLTLEAERATGCLRVNEGPIHTLFHLKNGVVLYAKHGTLAETLGRLLVREGTLEQDEYLLILEELSQPSPLGRVERFGEIAIRLGMLSAQDLHEGLALQVQRKLLHCLQLDRGSWTFEECPTTPPTSHPCPIGPMVLRAFLEDPETARWRAQVDHLGTHVARLRQDANELAQRLKVSPRQLRLLNQVNEQPIAMLLAGKVLPKSETAALIAILIVSGALSTERYNTHRFSKEQTRKNRERIDKLRADKEVNAGQVQRADETEPKVPTSGQATTRRLRSTMGRSEPRRHDTLRRPTKPKESLPEPGTQQARIIAEQRFERGKRELNQGAVNKGAMDKATASFEIACQLMPEALEYALHLLFCRFQGSRDAQERATLEQELRSKLLEALREDRSMSFAHYIRGRLFLQDGDEAAAHKALALAVRLDSSNLDANRYLRLLQGRRRR